MQLPGFRDVAYRVGTGVAPRGGVRHLANAGRIQNHQTDASKLRSHASILPRVRLICRGGVAFAGANDGVFGKADELDSPFYAEIAVVAFDLGVGKADRVLTIAKQALLKELAGIDLNKEGDDAGLAQILFRLGEIRRTRRIDTIGQRDKCAAASEFF